MDADIQELREKVDDEVGLELAKLYKNLRVDK
jgi:hypothetical protein